MSHEFGPGARKRRYVVLDSCSGLVEANYYNDLQSANAEANYFIARGEWYVLAEIIEEGAQHT